MTTAITYHQLGNKLNLDPAAVCFLSAIYYNTKQAGGPFTKTQEHLKNITSCTKYQQRRIRKQLEALGVMTESRKVEFVKDKGYRTHLYFKANIEKLDSLLADVEAARSKLDQQEKTESKPEAKEETKKQVLPVVKMHQEWRPDADSLASFLNAYNIDSRFAIHHSLDEFIGFWINKDCELTELQWQSKFHSAVRHQWQAELGKQRRTARIMAAADRKADALSALKNKQASKLEEQVSQIKTSRILEEKLNDTSWADGLYLDGEDF